jgi:hypothetical protein
MRITSLSLAALLVLVLASAAGAVDVWGGPPPDTWSRGQDGSTFQHWMFDTIDQLLPEVWDNPYGDPLAELSEGPWTYGAWECPEDIDPSGMCQGYHIENPGGGSVGLSIPNSPDPEGVKWIFVQVTSSKAPSSVTATTSGGHTSGTWPTGLPQIQHPGPAPFGGSWYTYNYGLYIQPNPADEFIVITVPYCTVIDQIVVDTICTKEPIPIVDGTWGRVKTLYR